MGGDMNVGGGGCGGGDTAPAAAPEDGRGGCEGDTVGDVCGVLPRISG